MQIAKLFSWVGPIAGCDFVINGDDEVELLEVPFNSDSGSDGVAKPITQN